MTILLSAGHYPAARGACHNDVCEHEEAVRWVGMIKSAIIGYHHAVDEVPTGPLMIRHPVTRHLIGGKIHWINKQRPMAKLVCEVHFNSDVSKTQHGSETLFCPGSVKGAACAAIVQDALGKIFPPSRGAKEGWYQMIRPPDPRAKPDAMLSETNPVALIIEPEFIYNYDDIESKRDEACVAIAKALVYCIDHALE